MIVHKSLPILLRNAKNFIHAENVIAKIESFRYGSEKSFSNDRKYYDFNLNLQIQFWFIQKWIYFDISFSFIGVHHYIHFTVTFSCQKIISEKVLECKKQVLSPRNRCHPAAYRWYRPCTGSIDGVASKRLFVVSMQCNCFIVFELTPWQL